MSISTCDQTACREGFGFNLENFMKSVCLWSAYLRVNVDGSMLKSFRTYFIRICVVVVHDPANP
jgi:hypothetical protein